MYRSLILSEQGLSPHTAGEQVLQVFPFESKQPQLKLPVVHGASVALADSIADGHACTKSFLTKKLKASQPGSSPHAVILDQQSFPERLDPACWEQSGAPPARRRQPPPAPHGRDGSPRWKASSPGYLLLQNILNDKFCNANQIFFSATLLDTSLSCMITASCQNSLVGKLFRRHAEV